MTMSTGTPRRSSSGSTVAQLPTRPTDSARPVVLGRQAAAQRVVEVVGDHVQVARARPAARSRAGSTSMTRQTPSFSVTASGCAPPMPPQPPVTVSVPASVPPNRFAATAANVS